MSFQSLLEGPSLGFNNNMVIQQHRVSGGGLCASFRSLPGVVSGRPGVLSLCFNNIMAIQLHRVSGGLRGVSRSLLERPSLGFNKKNVIQQHQVSGGPCGVSRSLLGGSKTRF